MEIKSYQEKYKEEWIELCFKLWPEETLETHRSEAEQMVALPDKYGIFFCIDKNQIVGFIEVSLRESMIKIEKEIIGYIEGWYVIDAYRGKGLGKELVQRAEAWAREKGCREIFSDTGPENHISQIAHHALGFEEIDQMILYRKILKEQ